jgi:hypothetical protein
MIRVRPYRCASCDYRFYGWRRQGSVPQELRQDRVTQASTFLLVVLLSISFAWSFQVRAERRVTPPPAPRGTPAEMQATARVPQFQSAGGAASFPRTSSAILHPAPASPFVAQAQRAALGALQVTGEVYVNNAPVEREGTVFAGDTVRTGATGAASITLAGRGRLILAASTEVVLAGASRYLASLEAGTVGLNALADAQSFQLRVGNFLVVPSPEAAATAEIERAADGSARITCMSGSVGVIALEGEEVVFLRAGQTGRISADGRFSLSTPAAPAQPTGQPRPPEEKKGRRTGLIVLLVGAGGAAGAAAALAGKKDGSPTLSPSVP